jgi:hypothetical protein
MDIKNKIKKGTKDKSLTKEERKIYKELFSSLDEIKDEEEIKKILKKKINRIKKKIDSMSLLELRKLYRKKNQSLFIIIDNLISIKPTMCELNDFLFYKDIDINKEKEIIELVNDSFSKDLTNKTNKIITKLKRERYVNECLEKSKK